MIELASPSGLVDREQQRLLMQCLAPHWVRTHDLFMRLDAAESLRLAYLDSANLARHAIVIFDSEGTRTMANDAAEALLPDNGISLTSTGIRATADLENQRLQRALREVIRPGNAVSSVELMISRPSGRSPLRAILTPLLAGYRSHATKPAAMLMIFDPDAPPEIPVERCAALFGLTRAEAQVAIGIMQGKSVEQLAVSQRRRVSTTRTLLKRVFQKTGVSRQGELASLMLNSPLRFQFPEERQRDTHERQTDQTRADTH